MTIFKTQEFKLPKPTTFKQITKFFLTKALRDLFTNILLIKTYNNQKFYIIFQVRLINREIITISTPRKSDKTSFTILSMLFKKMLRLNYYVYSNLKIIDLIFRYYIIQNENEDIILNEYPFKEVFISKNIKYMLTDYNIKIPLTFSKNSIFKKEFFILNENKYEANHIFIDDNEILTEIYLNNELLLKFHDSLIKINSIDYNNSLIIRKFLDNNLNCFVDKENSNLLIANTMLKQEKEVSSWT
uniref:hypothetical protein n=1 Tax=Amanita sinensis TaxID=67728 RepID=UPI001D0F8314|nr:hypothetical protein LK379_mgp26 [Amanita sinensis]QZN08163.1 hypothetical protein [Amanita sinensis]